jgi:hypothetical protein
MFGKGEVLLHSYDKITEIAAVKNFLDSRLTITRRVRLRASRCDRSTPAAPRRAA